MVLIFGISPGHQTAKVYCTSTKKHFNDFWINKISYNDEDKTDEMFFNLKNNAAKMFPSDYELGTLCIYLGNFDYSYCSNIRKKFIQSGLEIGFQAVEIIDCFTVLYLDGLRQTNFQPKNGDIIWIHNYGSWHIWKKESDGKSELIYYEKEINNTWIDESIIAKYEGISGKEPDVVIYGHEVRDYLVSFFKSRYKTYFLESFNFAAGSLVKAKIMAGKKKYLNFDAKSNFGRKLEIFIGLKQIFNVEPYETIPFEKVLKLKKEPTDTILNIFDGSTPEELQIPSSKICIIVIKCDENGIFKVSFPKESIIIVDDKKVEIYQIATESLTVFPATVDYNFDPPKVGSRFKLNSVSSGFITNFNKKQSQASLKIIFEKCLKIIGEMNEQVFLVLPDDLTNEQQKEKFQLIAKSAGFGHIAVIDGAFATLIQQRSCEEINCIN